MVLLTDFGLEGPYVGQMKGVLASLAPNPPVIDLTHAVQPQDVREGAFLLEVSWRWFPAGSVFLSAWEQAFGNADQAVEVRIGHWSGRGLRRTYGEAEAGDVMALFGSLGYLEVAVANGNAAERLGVGRGTSIRSFKV